MEGDQQPQRAPNDETSPGVAEEEPQQHRQTHPHHQADQRIVAMLPADQGISFEVAHRRRFDFRVRLPQHPADVCVPETAPGVIRIQVAVGAPVVASMVRRPGQHRVLESPRPEGQEQEAQHRVGLVGAMGKQPMVPGRDAEDGRTGQHHPDHRRGE